MLLLLTEQELNDLIETDEREELLAGPHGQSVALAAPQRVLPWPPARGARRWLWACLTHSGRGAPTPLWHGGGVRGCYPPVPTPLTPRPFAIQALFLDPSVQKSLTPAEASNVLAETRNVPHVKNALFNYTTHEARQ